MKSLWICWLMLMTTVFAENCDEIFDKATNSYPIKIEKNSEAVDAKIYSSDKDIEKAVVTIPEAKYNFATLLINEGNATLKITSQKKVEIHRITINNVVICGSKKNGEEFNIAYNYSDNIKNQDSSPASTPQNNPKNVPQKKNKRKPAHRDTSKKAEPQLAQTSPCEDKAYNKTNAWPWVARIFENGDFKCHGTVIEVDMVITAQKCVEKLEKEKITMEINGKNITNIEEVYENKSIAIISFKKINHLIPICLTKTRTPTFTMVYCNTTNPDKNTINTPLIDMNCTDDKKFCFKDETCKEGNVGDGLYGLKNALWTLQGIRTNTELCEFDEISKHYDFIADTEKKILKKEEKNNTKNI